MSPWSVRRLWLLLEHTCVLQHLDGSEDDPGRQGAVVSLVCNGRKVDATQDDKFQLGRGHSSDTYRE